VQSHEKLLWQDVYRAGDGCHREWLIRRFRYEPSSRAPLVWLAPHHRLTLALERHLLGRRRYRLIVANSQRVRADLGRHYGVPPGDVRVIYNGVDLDRFSPSQRLARRAAARAPLALPAGATALLFMGTGFQRKGLRYALRALGEAPKEVHLLVAGRDQASSRYEAEARDRGVAERVRFLGAVPEPESAYAAADGFVLPTIYEPFSNACLEALASGLPVITTRDNGAAELLSGHHPALVLDDPADHHGLAERMARLRDPAEREVLGAEARAIAETRPLAGMVAEFLAVYQELQGSLR
jgi:UDP-glucose:(heptosyl)LPS alpha-1,3-glucosyltransferase